MGQKEGHLVGFFGFVLGCLFVVGCYCLGFFFLRVGWCFLGIENEGRLS